MYIYASIHMYIKFAGKKYSKRILCNFEDLLEMRLNLHSRDGF